MRLLYFWFIDDTARLSFPILSIFCSSQTALVFWLYSFYLIEQNHVVPLSWSSALPLFVRWIIKHI